MKGFAEDPVAKGGGEQSDLGVPDPPLLGVAWDGYLAALLEWGAISPSQFDSLFDLLGKVDHDPVRSGERLTGSPSIR